MQLLKLDRVDFLKRILIIKVNHTIEHFYDFFSKNTLNKHMKLT